MAHSARGPRGGEQACLRGCWGGGDHACTRRGRRVVCERVSRVALWRALGMLSENFGMAWACGPVAGRVQALTRGWPWTVACVLDMVTSLGACSS